MFRQSTNQNHTQVSGSEWRHWMAFKFWNFVNFFSHFLIGLKFYIVVRRRLNSIPWCTSIHVILSQRTWHIIISNLQHAWSELTSITVLDVDGFQTCFGSAASAFEIIELAYIHCALKENFSVTLTKKGFTCISLICPELLCALSRTVNTN